MNHLPLPVELPRHPPLANLKHPPETEDFQQLGEGRKAFVPGRERQLDFPPGLGLPIELRPFVRDEVLLADAADAERFVRFLEVAAGMREVHVHLLDPWREGRSSSVSNCRSGCRSSTGNFCSISS